MGQREGGKLRHEEHSWGWERDLQPGRGELVKPRLGCPAELIPAGIPTALGPKNPSPKLLFGPGAKKSSQVGFVGEPGAPKARRNPKIGVIEQQDEGWHPLVF